jgi:hypothetical protein
LKAGKTPRQSRPRGGRIGMVELLRGNDPVLFSWVEALLKEAGILAVVMDQHMSVLEGSVGALPRRLMVAGADAARARRLLRDAGVALAAD